MDLKIHKIIIGEPNPKGYQEDLFATICYIHLVNVLEHTLHIEVMYNIEYLL